MTNSRDERGRSLLRHEYCKTELGHLIFLKLSKQEMEMAVNDSKELFDKKFAILALDHDGTISFFVTLKVNPDLIVMNINGVSLKHEGYVHKKGIIKRWLSGNTIVTAIRHARALDLNCASYKEMYRS